MLASQKPLVLIHSGISDVDEATNKKSLLLKLQGISKLIQKKLKSTKASAAEVCQFSVGLLEDEKEFNAGLGSMIQSDGVARLSASLMDGHKKRMSALINMEGVAQPSKALLQLLEEDDRVLSSKEASRYFLNQGYPLKSSLTEASLKRLQKQKSRKAGTVGAICIQSDGSTAAATSTGGKGNEIPGRVSDSATPAGNYANPYGAVSCTGNGEDILECSLASAICTRLEDRMTIQEAVSRSFLRNRERFFGVIGIDRKANCIAHCTRGKMGFAIVTKTKILVGCDANDWYQVVDRQN